MRIVIVLRMTLYMKAQEKQAPTLFLPFFAYYSGFFLDVLKKNSSSKKLRIQAKSTKTQAKFPKKLKNRQLHLSLVGGKFSNATIFGRICTIQYLTSDQSI